MNEFLEQFLIEGRELVEQATSDLLALEKQPDDAARLDGVFRAFHTLKGAAGIVEFAAMARALHAAEDVLSAVRAGTDTITSALIGDSLTALDQVSKWLDVIEVSDDLPSNADVAADEIVARFDHAPAEPKPDDNSAAMWRDLLAQPGTACIAIRYRPHPACFFQAQDPLTLVAQVPDLLALRLVPSTNWPGLDELDPFACLLTIMALSAATRDAATAVLRPVIDQVEIIEFAQPQADLPALYRETIEAQIRMLQLSDPEDRNGCLASAGRVAVNVSRHVGRLAEAKGMEDALDAAQRANDPALLIDALRGVLAETSAVPHYDTSAKVVESAPFVPDTTARTLRVDVERIDALVRLTGELTVIKNAVGHIGRLADAGTPPREMQTSLKEVGGQLDRLVADMQHAVLSIRVLPLRHVFQRFHRLVRDLSASLGKSIRLVTEGDDTEADKAIVEGLFEPLLHVLRNAADHGLEDTDERRAAGKPPQGTLRLRAARSGEQVIIGIADDGRGIDVDRVREVALQRGTADAEALAAMSDADVAQLIFAPGFSTATQVTSLSGRGVGMDAVRTAIERFGGRVSVESRRREGTTVHLILPFTVMITGIMTVEAGGQVFGLPLDAVVETVRITQQQIVPVGATYAFTLRDRIIPIFDLAEVVGIKQSQPTSTAAIMVIASLGGDLVGLRINRLGERMDVMMKPMDGLLAGSPGIAGTTLLGDGRVLIVLDLPELLK